MRSLLLSLAFLSVLGSFTAHAATLTENFTANGATSQNNSGGYGIDTTSFAAFDPSLGTLTGLTLSLSGTYTPSDSSDTSHLFNIAPGDDTNTDLSFNTSGSNFGIETSYHFGAAGTISPIPYFVGLGSDFLILEFNDAGTTSATTGSITYTYTAAPPAATPEPSSLMLLGTGVLGVAGSLRKRFA
jgi:hypothetical protein